MCDHERPSVDKARPEDKLALALRTVCGFPILAMFQLVGLLFSVLVLICLCFTRNSLCSRPPPKKKKWNSAYLKFRIGGGFKFLVVFGNFSCLLEKKWNLKSRKKVCCSSQSRNHGRQFSMEQKMQALEPYLYKIGNFKIFKKIECFEGETASKPIGSTVNSLWGLLTLRKILKIHFWEQKNCHKFPIL